MSTRPSAVVIGAGASGMVSALLLAMHGYRVSLIERAKEPGVTLRGFLKSRVYFDSGVHFIGELSPNGILTAYLRYLGIRDLPSVEFDRHCFETVRFSDGGDFSLAADYGKMLGGLCADFPAEKEGIHRYMADVKAAYGRKIPAYHPDRKAGVGDDFRVLAEERSKEINEAYQFIRQSRHV